MPSDWRVTALDKASRGNATKFRGLGSFVDNAGIWVCRWVSPVSKGETDPCPGAGGTCREGFKLNMRGEGDKTRPARGEPWGAIMGLGVR